MIFIVLKKEEQTYEWFSCKIAAELLIEKGNLPREGKSGDRLRIFGGEVQSNFSL